VTRDTQQVCAKLTHSCRNIPDRLRRIGMQRNTLWPGNLGDLVNRLNRPDFVVCMHHAHKDRVGCDRCAYLLRVNESPESTGRWVSFAPSDSRNLQGARTAGCSIAVVMTWGGPGVALLLKNTPLIAALLLRSRRW